MTLARTVLAATMVAALLFVAAACSSGGDETTPGATETPPTEPTSTPPPLPPGLQQILDHVAAIRELDPPPALRAEIISREDLPALLDSLITDHDRELMAQATTLYRLLGHFTRDQDYLTLYQEFGAGSILGLYSPKDDTLWVVSDNPDMSFDNLPKDEEETLAHELVHALQDYHFDLDKTYKQVEDNLDRSLAWTAVVEGDASVHQRLYAGRYLFLPLSGSAGGLFAAGILPQATDIPISFVRELIFPYTTGADWVAGLVQSQGRDYIDRLLADPPVGTVCVLHSQQCLGDWRPESVTLPDISAALGSGWSRESGGTLGEFHVANFLDLELSRSESDAAAAGWDGDHYDVYVAGDQSVALFRLAFAGESDAAEFRTALSGVVGGFSGGDSGTAVLPDGREFALAAPEGSFVTFAIGSQSGLADSALGALSGG